MESAIDLNSSTRPLPNATAVLVLGILSIPLCCCYGVVSLTLGIIALALASKDLSMYAANPQAFSEKSLKNLKAGKVCAIIGVCLGGLYLLYVIFLLSVFGTAIFTNPQVMQEAIQEMMNQ